MGAAGERAQRDEQRAMNWNAKSRDTDQVKLESIWREHLIKEAGTTRVNAEFHANPRTLHPIPDKPNATVPKANTANSPMDEELVAKLQTANKIPREKYEFPQTEAQMIGWLSDPLVARNPRFHKPISYCTETKYVEEVVKFGNKAF